MSKRNDIKIADEIEYFVRDKNGNVKKHYKSNTLVSKLLKALHLKPKNCMTNAGFAEVAGLMLTDVGGTAFDYIAIGTGTNAAAATDTALQTEIKRKAGTGTRVTTTVTNDTAQLTATFSSADGLSGSSAVTEVGMFNASSSGTMLMRQTFAAENMNWDAGDSLQMIVKIQCKQGT